MLRRKKGIRAPVLRPSAGDNGLIDAAQRRRDFFRIKIGEGSFRIDASGDMLHPCFFSDPTDPEAVMVLGNVVFQACLLYTSDAADD